jgi:hypothetical protein
MRNVNGQFLRERLSFGSKDLAYIDFLNLFLGHGLLIFKLGAITPLLGSKVNFAQAF